MPRIYHPSGRIWFRTDWLVILYLILVTLSYLGSWRWQIMLLYSILLLPVLAAAVRTAIALRRFRFELDDDGLRIRNGVEEASFAWDEIEAAWVEESEGERTLFVGNGDRMYRAAIGDFEDGDEALWDEIRLHLPTEVVGEDACRRLPQYREEQREAEMIAAAQEGAVSVRSSADGLVWMFFVCLMTFAIAATAQGEPVSAAILFCASLGCVWVISLGGRVTISKLGIERTTIFGRFLMPWKDVKVVRQLGGVRASGGTILFVGRDKWLSMPPPGSLSGRRRDEFIALLDARLTNRGLRIESSRESSQVYRVEKNCRVPRDRSTDRLTNRSR